MIGYVTVGTNKFEEAAEFYDALFETLGAGRAFDAGYFRDLDGNKLNAFCFVSE